MDITDVINERLEDAHSQSSSQTKPILNDELKQTDRLAADRKEFGFNTSFEMAIDIAHEIQQKVFKVIFLLLLKHL